MPHHDSGKNTRRGCSVAFIPFDAASGHVRRETKSCCIDFPEPLKVHAGRPIYIMLDDEHMDDLDLVEAAVRDYFYNPHKGHKKDKCSKRVEDDEEEDEDVEQEEKKHKYKKITKKKKCEPFGNSRGRVVRRPSPIWVEPKFSDRITPHRPRVRQTVDGRTCEDLCD